MSGPRLRKTSHIDAPADHDGPALIDPNRRKEFGDYTQPNLLSGIKNEQTRVTLAAFLLAPFHRTRGVDPEEAPSLWTTIVAGLLIFVSCLTYAWIYITAIDQALAAGGSIFIQAILLALVSAIMFLLTMNWSWEPLLRTQVYFGMLFALVGTFDIGIVVFFGFAAVQLGGWAAGGAITNALGLASPGPLFIMPAATNAGHWMYWFGGSMIIFSYILIQKFVQRDFGKLANTETKNEKDRRAIMYTAFAIFGFTLAFRSQGLYYFDAGPFIASWAATGLGDATADGVLDWAFYWFVPLASAATALLLYYAVQFTAYASDQWDKREPLMPATNAQGRAFYAPSIAKKVDVF